MSKRYAAQKPIILTSNKSYGQWDGAFPDRVLATALLDGLLHHTSTINIRGESYRLRHRREAGVSPTHLDRGGNHRKELNPETIQRGVSNFGPSNLSTSSPLLAVMRDLRRFLGHRRTTSFHGGHPRGNITEPDGRLTIIEELCWGQSRLLTESNQLNRYESTYLSISPENAPCSPGQSTKSS